MVRLQFPVPCLTCSFQGVTNSATYQDSGVSRYSCSDTHYSENRRNGAFIGQNTPSLNFGVTADLSRDPARDKNRFFPSLRSSAAYPEGIILAHGPRVLKEFQICAQIFRPDCQSQCGAINATSCFDSPIVEFKIYCTRCRPSEKREQIRRRDETCTVKSPLK